MVSVLESYQHRIETGGGLCRSFTGTKPHRVRRSGRDVAFVVLSAPERVPRFKFRMVPRLQAFDANTGVPYSYGEPRMTSMTRLTRAILLVQAYYKILRKLLWYVSRLIPHPTAPGGIVVYRPESH